MTHIPEGSADPHENQQTYLVNVDHTHKNNAQ